MKSEDKVIKNLLNDKKVFMDTNTFKVSKDEQVDIFKEAVDILSKNSTNQVLKVKFAALLHYLCEESNRNIKDVIKDINKLIGNEVLDTHTYRLNTLNSKFMKAFKENKACFEFYKAMLINNTYNTNTLIYYWEWLEKHKILAGLDYTELTNIINNGGKILDVLVLSSKEMQCTKCGEVKHISKIHPGKTYCKCCATLEISKRRKGESTKIKDIKREREMDASIESRIRDFKSDDIAQDEVSTSREFALYQGLYGTIINSLYEMLEIDTTKFSLSEKEEANTNNINMLKMIGQIGEKTWAQ